MSQAEIVNCIDNAKMELERELTPTKAFLKITDTTTGLYTLCPLKTNGELTGIQALDYSMVLLALRVLEYKNSEDPGINNDIFYSYFKEQFDKKPFTFSGRVMFWSWAGTFLGWLFGSLFAGTLIGFLIGATIQMYGGPIAKFILDIYLSTKNFKA